MLYFSLLTLRTHSHCHSTQCRMKPISRSESIVKSSSIVGRQVQTPAKLTITDNFEKRLFYFNISVKTFKMCKTTLQVDFNILKIIKKFYGVKYFFLNYIFQNCFFFPMFKNFLYRRNIFTLMPELTAGWVKQVVFVCV